MERTEDNEEFEILLCTPIEEYEQFDNSLNDRDLQKKMVSIFTCVAKGEIRSRSRVTPSACPSVLLSQNLVIATPLKLLIQLS